MVIKTAGLFPLWIAFMLLAKLLKVVPDFARISLALKLFLSILINEERSASIT